MLAADHPSVVGVDVKSISRTTSGESRPACARHAVSPLIDEMLPCNVHGRLWRSYEPDMKAYSASGALVLQ